MRRQDADEAFVIFSKIGSSRWCANELKGQATLLMWPVPLATSPFSDHLVMPPGAMRLGGTGANRTLTLTPAANRTGSVVITLTVSDGTRTGSGTCKLTIQPTSAPTGVSPAIAIGSDRGKSCGHGLNLAGLLVAVALYRLRRRGGEGNKDGWP